MHAWSPRDCVYVFVESFFLLFFVSLIKLRASSHVCFFFCFIGSSSSERAASYQMLAINYEKLSASRYSHCVILLRASSCYIFIIIDFIPIFLLSLFFSFFSLSISGPMGDRDGFRELSSLSHLLSWRALCFLPARAFCMVLLRVGRFKLRACSPILLSNKLVRVSLTMNAI